MRVIVDGMDVEILQGMTVRHALIRAGKLNARDPQPVYDEWGNEISLDGELSGGDKIYTKKIKENK